MNHLFTLLRTVGWLFMISCQICFMERAFGDQHNPTVCNSEYIIIVHDSLMCDAVNDLKAFREQQNYKVCLHEVADDWTFDMIKTLIQDHYNPLFNSYQPLYVLLIGNATMDTLYWNIADASTGNFIPSYWEWPESEHTGIMLACDEAYVYTDDEEPVEVSNPIPDLYIGRIPASTQAEVTVFIEKLFDYENNSGQQSWKDNVLLIAGDKTRNDPPPPGTPFPGGVSHTSQILVDDHVPISWDAEILYYSACPDSIVDTTYIIDNRQNRADTLSLFMDDGQLLISALGTGASKRNLCYYVKRDFFDAEADLSNYLKYPVMYAASCGLGNFDSYDYMGIDTHYENFLFADSSGAIAWIAPTWATWQNSDFALSHFFYRAFFEDKAINVGRLNYLTKHNGHAFHCENRCVKQFNLYGDPGMNIAVNPGFVPAFSYTGFELSHVRIFQNDTFYTANCIDLCARILPEKYAVESPFREAINIISKRVYGIKGEDTSNNHQSRAYWVLWDENIPINLQSRFLTFWMYVEESPQDLGHICLDAVVIDDDPLHDQLIYDQYGQRIGAEYHTCASGNWEFFAFDLISLYGKTLDNLLIGYDDGDNSEIGDFKAYVDEVRFSYDWGYPPYVYRNTHPDTLQCGQTDTVSVYVIDSDVIWDRGDTLTFVWSAVLGSIDTINNDTTTYHAPDSIAGGGAFDTVFCMVSDQGLHSIQDTMLIYIEGGQLLVADIPIVDFNVNCSPNPFNAETVIAFDLPEAGQVSLEVYNLMGQKVATLIDGNMPAGQHSVTWDASRFASGIYFYKLTAGDKIITKRMTLLK
jgi:hypothetical protein